MSATNTTPNIGLPSFIGTDKPSWLTDWNGAMSTIDSEIGTLKTDLSGDETRIGNLENSVSSLNTTVSNHTTSITALNTQVSNQGGTINTITSLIGNGTPTTTDQTIIGAINELNAGKAASGFIAAASLGDTISVTSDGTKTVKQLLESLAAAVLAAIQAEDSGIVYEIEAVSAYAAFNPRGSQYILPSATTLDITCDGTEVTGTGTDPFGYITEIKLSDSDSYFRRITLNAASSVYGSLDSQIVTSGRSFYVRYSKYKTV